MAVQMSPKKVYGDFQTPITLARQVAEFIKQHHPSVGTIIEPTCGVGAFLQASIETFGKTPKYFGFDINSEYVTVTKQAISVYEGISIKVKQKDFYEIDWNTLIEKESEPILVIGNPPWITNAAMGTIGGGNLPTKSNFQGHNGFAARTGKANFDISEWMLIKLIEALQGKNATIAMLCKTATARKVLRHAWINGLEIGSASLHLFDSSEEFDVSVDACLFYTAIGNSAKNVNATCYQNFSFNKPINTFGLLNGELVSDVHIYEKMKIYDGIEYRKWRSGVKHDASQIMEFIRDGNLFVNGLGERCEIEEDYIFPLLKSSDLANGRLKPTRFVLLTQKKVSDRTDDIESNAPKTWQYLLNHAKYLDKRGSSIYKNRARFSVFGVGDYSFTPAKVAVSGLYKNLQFQAVGSALNKPIMVDDTSNFIPCNSFAEAKFFAELLNSDICQKFISALIFSDAKRPLTIDVLRRVDLKKIAEYAELEGKAIEYLSSPAPISIGQKTLVFEEKKKYKTKKIPMQSIRDKKKHQNNKKSKIKTQ